MKLSRKKEYRDRTLRNLVTSMILYERIITTKSRAKAVRPILTRLLNLAQQGDLNSLKKAKGILMDRKAVNKLFEDISKRFDKKNKNLIKVIPIRHRLGDNAPLVQLSLTIKPIEQAVTEEEKSKNKHDTENKTTN